MRDVCVCAQTLMELVKRRKRLSEPEARYWTLQLLDATRYMHANGVIHRDLKLGNLFVNEDMELRVGDFGLATWLARPNERRRTLCGTPNYIAPEILEQPAAGHSFEVDTWSIGVILYTLLVGRPPFETASVEETYQRIRDCAFAFPHDCGVSAPARDLISWILQKDPAARPSLLQVRVLRWRWWWWCRGR
jgi:serine/threonine protein kinase